MKIWIHRYQLNPMDLRFKPRAGALLKVEWAFEQIGYSDLHPWPEFGEPSLDEHIESLRKVQFTHLAGKSLEFNYIDREYRLTRVNAFSGLIPPRSHRLVTDLLKVDGSLLADWFKQGFSHIKVKMGGNLAAETEVLVQNAFATPLMWRIDLNGKLSAPEFTDWWKNLGEAVKPRIDFIEDPTSGEELKFVGPWANDWIKQERAQVRILKPAREGVEELAKYSRLIFTHGMDHPLGQACAAWAASRFYANHPKKTEVCGLAAPSLYEPNDFSKQWTCEGPRMKPTTGMGFGFDDLLVGLKWERIL